IDRANPSYAGDNNLGTMNGIDHIVSFGEDNLGNLYLVDFGYGLNFGGQYTANGGEIFKLVPGPLPPQLNWSNIGSRVRFTWSGTFKLQYQTNSLPLGVGANWIDYPGGGSSGVIVPFDTSQETIFFRLIWPP